MNTPLRKIFNYIKIMTVVLLGLAALLSAAGRWIVYDIDRFREPITLQIAQLLDAEVSIAELGGRVAFFNPILDAKQVSLINPETATQPLRVNRIEVAIDIIDSLLHAALRIRSIQIIGIEIAAYTDFEHGLLRLPQLGRQWHIPQQQFDLDALIAKALAVNDLDFGIHDALIHWHNQGVATQTVRVQQLTVSSHPFRTQLALTAEWLSSLGQKLSANASLTPSLSGPAGDFYLRAENLDLTTLPQFNGTQAAHSGLLQAEVWGYATYPRGLHDITASLSLKDYLNPTFNPDAAVSLQTQLHWKAQSSGIELGLTNLSLQSGEDALENAECAIVQTRSEDSYFSNIRLRAEHLTTPLIQRLLSYAQSDWTIADSTNSSNHKQTIDLTLQTRHSADWLISATNWPLLRSSEGDLSAALPQLLSAQLKASLNDIQLSRGRWNAPQNLEHIVLKGSYENTTHYTEWRLEDLFIKGSESELIGHGAYSLSDKAEKRLQSSLRLHKLAATEVVQWIPPHTLKTPLEQWLHNALRGGTIEHATLTIDGDPDFPFADNGELWRLQARGTDIKLAYRRGDPELKELNIDLLLENRSLKIHSDHLRLMDFRATKTTVLIDDISAPYIQIRGQGRGTLAAILNYASTTKLVDPNCPLIANLTADGDVGLHLTVQMPLSSSITKERYVGGHVDFNGASIKLKNLALNITRLTGRLHFDKHGGRAAKLKALLNDLYPATVSATPQAGSTLLQMEASIPFPADYLRDFSLPANTFNTAADTWRATLLIPPLQPNAPSTLQLKLSSQLESLAINMPAPLHKRSGTAVPSTLSVDITERGSRYRLDYGDHLRLIMQLPITGTATGLLHFSPRIAYPYKTNANTQFAVRGIVPYLSINEWLSWLSQYHNTTQLASVAYDADLSINELVWNASTAHRVHLKVKSQQEQTLMIFDSEEIQGQAVIPADPDKRAYIYLKHLILNLNGGNLSDSNMLDPTTLPPLAIKIDQFKSGRFAVNHIKASLTPHDKGVRIAQLTFNKKIDDKNLIAVRLEGDWHRIAAQDYSHFKFVLNSDDYGQLLHDWDFYSELNGGQGRISGQLQWHGNPLDLRLDHLEGPLQLHIKNGTIEAIEPGVGKLFGLLNINALARRLRLDFKDVFDKGFEFDSMQGTLEFAKANLLSQNLNINGPALDMQIKGRTGITQRDYDQIITVVPHIGSNVALASSFLGGPLTAATVFLLSKVTELDNWIDQIITLEYTLQGSWENPEVKFTSVPIAKGLDPVNKGENLPHTDTKSILHKIFH